VNLRLYPIVLIALVSCPALAEDRYPLFVSSFAAIESTGYPSAQAYSFDLACEKDECVLNRITFEECKTSSDKRGKTMKVRTTIFSTRNQSLDIKFLTKRSLQLRFTAPDFPYDAEFQITLSTTDDIVGAPLPFPLTSSFSGLLLKKPHKAVRAGDLEEQSIELRGTKSNELFRLKRDCPIGLITF
jgi:hypothetical protein